MADSIFDFKNAQLPKLNPLGVSHAENTVEDELKRLAAVLWDDYLAVQAFDLNVSGMAHLGSFPFVRKSVNQDGLVLLPNAGEEPSTRYLYRAWKARNHNGRGKHFARTYLQMLFPNAASIVQLYLRPGEVYPDDCFSPLSDDGAFYPRIEKDSLLRVDGTWRLGEAVDASKLIEDGTFDALTDGLILTTRLLITIDISVDAAGLGNLLQILRAVMGARFLPVFRYTITAYRPEPMEACALVNVTVPTRGTYGNGLFVTNDPDWQFNLCLEADNSPGAVRLMPEHAYHAHADEEPQDEDGA